MDRNKAAAGLNAFGVTAYSNSRGLVVHVPNKRKRCIWKVGREHGYVETIVRAAVLKVVPGTFVRQECAEDNLLVVTPGEKDEEGYQTLYRLAQASTYTEAWINAAIALYEAGRAPYYEVKKG